MLEQPVAGPTDSRQAGSYRSRSALSKWNSTPVRSTPAGLNHVIPIYTVASFVLLVSLCVRLQFVDQILLALGKRQVAMFHNV